MTPPPKVIVILKEISFNCGNAGYEIYLNAQPPGPQSWGVEGTWPHFLL